jgi:hypothetical protein
MDEVRWMAIVHCDPHWEVERRFKLPDNMLAKKASLESSWSNSEANSFYVPATHHIEGKSNDMVVWYEIYSKCGVGTRRTELYEPVKDHLEESVGDFAYLAICPALPFPLNAPVDKVLKGASTEEVKRMFDWPIPSFYKDDRWPAEFLDMYPNIDEKDESAVWPIPPLAPALGEIKVLNYIVPFLVNRTWMSSRDFWAVARWSTRKLRALPGCCRSGSRSRRASACTCRSASRRSRRSSASRARDSCSCPSTRSSRPSRSRTSCATATCGHS